MFKMSLLIMSKGKKTYWKGVAQLENKEFANEIASNEFSEHLPVNDFLRQKKTLQYLLMNLTDFGM